MIIGLGIDLVDLDDMERRLERGTIARVFSAAERAYADSQPHHRTQILAARWAAREAFGKALGTGLKQSWLSELPGLEVVHDESGRPGFSLSLFFTALVPENTRVHLSLTHTPQSAAAIVILESA